LIEHLTQKQVEAYCRQRLEVVELLSVSDHLGECEACRQQIEAAMQGDATFFALRSEVFGEAAETSSPPLVRAHLTAEQAADYVDSNLSGEALQRAADHLTHCESCALAVDDLHAFRDQIAPALEREYHPAAVAAPTEGWWQRTVAPLSAFFQRSPALAFGAGLAILLLAVTGWLIWRTPRVSEPEQAVVVTPAPPPPPTAPLSPPAPVSLVAQLNDGEGQLILDQEGKLSGADSLPPAYQGMLKEALTTRRIERSSRLKGLSRSPSALMSTDKPGSEFSVLDPVGNVLLTDHPTFRWSPLAGASVYVVEVYDNKFNLVITSPELAGHSWTPPQALARGEVYAWQVKAAKDGQEFKSPQPPAPQARFRILDQAKANELAKARRAYASSHLALGLLYAEAGLLKEAEQELRMLQTANPDSELARRLLSQVQALRRRSD
jgi:anti-sigma factor RsiW